ncbi:MAG: S8 family peptidase [Verrucomicrobiales bacterium]
MSQKSDRIRLGAYLGVGAIFLGLLAFIFLAFPDLTAGDFPKEAKQARKKNFQSGSSLGDERGKSITDPSDAEGADAENDPSLAGEVILRADSKEELALRFSHALESGGEFQGLIKELIAARFKFPTREAADRFRESLGDPDGADSNYIVMAPDFPTDEELSGQAPTTPGERTSQNVSGQVLEPFGNGALEFLGVTGDNSEWGRDLVIAVLDSGVYAHESLTGINIRQIDLVQTAEDPQADYTGHGTAVADIAHLLAPAADLLSVRVLDSQGIGDTFSVAQGIIAAADNGADVINLSLGSYGDSSVLRDAVEYAVSRGSAVVAASGNDGINQVSFPAAYDSVIGVSAVDANGQYASFSNYGEGIDLGAPGVGVYTAWDEDGQAQFSGTSAASPFVAAAIAATISLNPGYTVNQAVEKVLSTAQDTGENGVDPQTGQGVIHFDE